jgi:hypothetical protein
MATAATLLLTALASGCGERTLSAEEFVSEVEDEGVELELGKELISEDEDKELYELELEPLPGADLPGGVDPAHTAGSLAVYDEVDQAVNGLEECESAADLVCYRAANVVVVLEGNTIEAQRLAVAIQKLAQE